MADLNHNGIDDALEAKLYKAQAVNAKFKQQVSYGIGAATVFGLVGAVAHAMINPLFVGGFTTLSAAAVPVLGLAALATVGIGLLYLSAKYLSENIVLDQQLQANQISAATARARTQELVTGHAPKVEQFPDGVIAKTAAQNDNIPSTVIGNERELASTISQGAYTARAV